MLSSLIESIPSSELDDQLRGVCRSSVEVGAALRSNAGGASACAGGRGGFGEPNKLALEWASMTAALLLEENSWRTPRVGMGRTDGSSPIILHMARPPSPRRPACIPRKQSTRRRRPRVNLPSCHHQSRSNPRSSRTSSRPLVSATSRVVVKSRSAVVRPTSWIGVENPNEAFEAADRTEVAKASRTGRSRSPNG